MSPTAIAEDEGERKASQSIQYPFSKNKTGFSDPFAVMRGLFSCCAHYLLCCNDP